MSSNEKPETHSKLKSRKLWALIIVGLLSTVFFVQERATFAEWADVMKWAFGIYTTGNVVSTAAYRLSKPPQLRIPDDEQDMV